MRILVSVALAVAIMAALVIGITLAGRAVSRSAGQAVREGPMRSGFLPRVAYILLWFLIFGTASGFIGGA
ncbi:hypothetical protein R3X27_03080 [Tropicimonas sp. TH_r6]|uniref:hypothetical protein n=1 Tax=Tropicimonas sp. TH_r6 TaxID=3082085 RepID=UPI0029552D89|nr:hypothetical protein [Tropicimonas sp. TH_r6]MDV7141659.1 hypothetical protein [Tropicimonas sp. TH_r6]